jgi:acyl-CoA synthetase (AMP-forming)/AMP-acid ligase II
MTEFFQYEDNMMPLTITSLLRTRAEQQPDDVAYAFVSDGGEEQVTYAELDKRARAVGRLLGDLHVVGQPVLLVYPPGIDYLSALFGCWYAGAIAVPTPPPHPLQPRSSLPRLTAVAGDATPCLALATAAAGEALSSLSGSSPELSRLQVMTLGEVSAKWSPAWEPEPAGADSIALVQYTSAPRGAVFDHRDLISSSELILRLSGRSRESRGVTWLPPYHGMGLVGGIIQPLHGGFPVTLMAPDDFMRQPLRWLQEISRTRATTSGGPDYAYDLCVEKTTAEERLTLDLSNWQVAFNGSEQVCADTMERFARAFEPAGFRREAFHPCYGFTQDALMVAGGIPWSRRSTKSFDAAALRYGAGIPGEADGESCRLVSCGYASVDHCRVVIVDPMTYMECPEGRVGEIWMSGSGVARSYWRRPQETREVLLARLAGTADTPFARSGDLGFMLDHELFVTGRIGDLITVSMYPDDLEPALARDGRDRGQALTVADPLGHVAEARQLHPVAETAPSRSDARGQPTPWFLQEIGPGTAEHRIAIAMCFRGRLAPSAFDRTLDALVAQWASALPSADGEPDQLIIGKTRAWLRENDARDLDDAQFTKWLESAAREPFDLAHGPLLRIHLYRRTADETVALIVAHHFITDFWSMTTLVRELETLYSEQKGIFSAPLQELTEFVRHYRWIGGSRVSAYAAVCADSAACPDGCRLGQAAAVGAVSPITPENAPQGIGSLHGPTPIGAGLNVPAGFQDNFRRNPIARPRSQD